MTEKKYDVCIVCFNYINNDARSLNLANILVKSGKSVAVICIEDKDIITAGFDILPVSVNISLKLPRKLFNFTRLVKKKYSFVKAEYFIASELYSLLATRLIQKKTTGKLIYDSREIFSALGNIHDQPLKQFFFSKLEKSLISKVDEIIVSGKLDAEYLKKYFNHSTPYYVIMNLPFYQNRKETDLIRKTFSIGKNTKVLLYQGMIMKGRGIETAIRAMTELDDCALCIMGTGNDILENYKRLVKELNLTDRIFFKSFVPYNELHQWTCSADIGLALFEPLSLSYRLALPNKLFEYAMAGLPAIVTNLPAINEIITEFHFGELLDYPFDIQKLVNTVREIVKPEIYSEYRFQALQASNKYNYERQIPIIHEIFNIK